MIIMKNKYLVITVVDGEVKEKYFKASSPEAAKRKAEKHYKKK